MTPTEAAAVNGAAPPFRNSLGVIPKSAIKSMTIAAI
jgi:hypothetical protein